MNAVPDRTERKAQADTNPDSQGFTIASAVPSGGDSTPPAPRDAELRELWESAKGPHALDADNICATCDAVDRLTVAAPTLAAELIELRETLASTEAQLVVARDALEAAMRERDELANLARYFLEAEPGEGQ